MSQLFDVRVSENSLHFSQADPRDYPYLARMDFRKRYWSEETNYDDEYLDQYYRMIGWCSRNLAVDGYQGKTGTGRMHYIFIKSKREAMMVKLAWASCE